MSLEPDTPPPVDPALARLRVYQEARTVIALVYSATEHFADRGHAMLADQMRRAAVSVVSNIGEGHGRTSPRDKARCFDIARGSLSELRVQLDVATAGGLLSKQALAELSKRAMWVARLLAGLRRSALNA